MELNIEKIKADTEGHLFRNKIILALLFLTSVLGFILLYYCAPPMSASDQAILYRVPATSEMLFKMSQTIHKYTHSHYYYVAFSISYLYILLQSFSIPGPPLLNMLAGALFGFNIAFLLATFCSTLGSILCFVIFETVGKGIAIRLFPNAIISVHNKVYRNRDNLFFYLLSLRVTPFIPKWLTSISSPIIGVPLKTFALSALFGLIPHNFIHVNTGVAISSLEDFGLTLNNILCLAGLGALCLVPPLLSKNKNKQE